MATPDNLDTEPGANDITTTGSDAEPIKPTADTSVTKQEGQEPGQDVTNLDDPSKTGDEPANVEGSDATDDDENVQYLELDGEEHSLDDVRKWKNGSMMQSDYTKKTTEHAQFAKKERAEIALDRENLLKSQSEVSEMRDQLAVLVTEDENIDWVELKESDLEKYVELKEKADKRRETLDKIKAERETPVDDPAAIQVQQEKFMFSDPTWLEEKDGNKVVTEQYMTDMKLLNDYAATAGFSKEEFSRITQSHQLNTILDAARWKQLQEKSRKIKEKRTKVPLVTKPKATKTGGRPKTAGEIFFPSVK